MSYRVVKQKPDFDPSVLDDFDRLCFDGTDGCLAESKGHQFWLVKHGRETIAYASAAVLDDGCVHLTRCAVHPKYRGMGLQKRLIETRLRWARRHASLVKTYTTNANYSSLSRLISCRFWVSGFENGYVFLTREL